MTGTEYERWCAQELKRLGYKNVRMTKASHDQGIDLTAEDKGISWGFQCKYYASPVGNDAVQQAYAGKTYYGLDRAAVLCSGSFTASARQLAQQTDVELWERFGPQEINRASLILRIPALILLFYCFYLFFQLMKDPYMYQKEMTVLAFGVGCCVSLVIGASRFGALVFAVLCAFAAVLGGLAMTILRPAAVCFGFLLILSAIRAVVFLRQRLERNYGQQKEELLDLIAETQDSLAKEIRTHLEDGLSQSVRITETSFNTDGTMRMICRVRGSLDDLALCEYTLNRQAEAEKAPFRFMLERMDAKTFAAVISRQG